MYLKHIFMCIERSSSYLSNAEGLTPNRVHYFRKKLCVLSLY